ncbi:MAG: transcriptional repressor LexA [Sphaerochaetaceae bacterium]|nr:transcriptional repressor LexA [Sphaerochaetaceae bacterium]
MRGLTKRQQEVVEFIENYMDKNGFSPSVRDIADNFGFSPKAAYDHMTALKKKGIIRTADNLPRGLALVKRTQNTENVIFKVPIMGTTAAGAPIFSEENYDGYVSVPQSLLSCSDSENLYALRVRGDSMIEDGINDGDLAIMLKTKFADNGDIVAASIGEDEEYSITLKHFYKTADRYELRPANSAYKSLISTHCDVHGKLLMIIRNY